mmetsp:Transcript_30151/g.53027  ORF Transcript_30151/g.53027 Transcript_30151/m.53027 type:complete len:287 (+) Transcript_30151:240-1100(+)|eukprot:CAMPEP_0197526052 /NCGR_PEP_ID=MMETSP1318-20131121/16011_1 /TAXON_ID=552666 /ORGANISM="Partenskyella glossopodia, Strain RCC365" /LENGTH=286 /DNA_ID=CAMNT_0043079993 /DNA_START=170 /DNA_END=1030 /DNA_ORIENTATION=+
MEEAEDDDKAQVPVPVKYTELGQKIHDTSFSTLSFFMVVAAANFCLGIWAFKLYFTALPPPSCVQNLSKTLFTVGALYLTSGVLTILACFCTRAILVYTDTVSRHLEPHYEHHSYKKARLAAESDRKSKGKPKTEPEPIDTDSSGDEEMALVERELAAGLLSRDQINSLTDNASLGCCGACYFVCFELVKQSMGLLSVAVFFKSDCQGNDDGEELLTKARIFVIVQLVLIAVVAAFYIVGYRVCCQVCEVMQSQHELLKHVQNKAVNRFWKHEKRHRRRSRHQARL